MTSKKKLTIALVSLVLVLVVAIMSVVLIMAALNATVKSGITIKYTAYNVDAEVKATYQISNQEEINIYTDAEKTNNVIGFEATEKSGVEKAFQPTGNIEIGPTDRIVFHYTVTNLDDSQNLYVTLSHEMVQLENVDPVAHGGVGALSDKWNEGLYDGLHDYYTVAPNQTFNLYMLFWVVEDTQDAVVDGTVNFVLSTTQPSI